MTPEEQATQWAVRVRHGDPAWVRDIVPQLASIIREAVTEERERCAKIAGEYASGFDPNHREERCGATGRDIEKRIRG